MKMKYIKSEAGAGEVDVSVKLLIFQVLAYIVTCL